LNTFFSAAFTDAYRRKEIQRIEEFKTNILYFNSVGIKDELLAMLGRTDTTQSLKTTKIPVLLITKEDDKIISPDQIQKDGK